MHDGIRDATGTEVSGRTHERAMPQPQPHQATCAVAGSVLPPLAHHGLARLVWRWLWRALRSVGQGLEHNGARVATCSEVQGTAVGGSLGLWVYSFACAYCTEYGTYYVVKSKSQTKLVLQREGAKIGAFVALSFWTGHTAVPVQLLCL